MSDQLPYSGIILPYFSPKRPTLNGTPQLLHPDGRPTLSILPDLIIKPYSDDSFTLWCYLHVEGHTSAPHECACNDWTAVGEAVVDWLRCPERFAWERMNWRPRDAPPPPKAAPFPSRELNLDDLLGDL